MALDAEAAQPTISAHIALRIAISVYGFDRRLQLAEQTGPAASRQFTFPRWSHRRPPGISIRGIDGTYARTAIAAGIKSARVVIGIRDAVEKSSRSGGLTLLVAGKGAVAETRIIIALNAKRITASDGFGRHGANHGQSARRQHGQNCTTHESLLIDSLKQPKPSAWVPVNSLHGFSTPTLASSELCPKQAVGAPARRSCQILRQLTIGVIFQTNPLPRLG